MRAYLRPAALVVSTSVLALPALAATESVDYSFKGKNHASPATATLLSLNGALYGTTRSDGDFHLGTVYKITKSGVERVIHSFGGGADGQTPYAGLIQANGAFYGTTSAGGAFGLGTVFSITPAGIETVLHSFSGEPDGQNPQAALINVGGTLYGTTYGGGANGKGAVFSITPAGAEEVLYSFQGYHDGRAPAAGLVQTGRTLYGTTEFGGNRRQQGTIFSLTLAGVETVLHVFQDDGTGGGISPVTGLVKVGGKLFGTAQYGGTGGSGIVFSTTHAGVFNVVYNFTGRDGNPSGLINLGGTLYGTTGVQSVYNPNFEEGVFALTPDGVETVLHTFTNTPDAYGPEARSSLINVDGTLYGTTDYGGTYGVGAIFEVKP